MADQPEDPHTPTPPTDPTAAADKPSGAAPAEPLKGEVSRTTMKIYGRRMFGVKDATGLIAYAVEEPGVDLSLHLERPVLLYGVVTREREFSVPLIAVKTVSRP